MQYLDHLDLKNEPIGHLADELLTETYVVENGVHHVTNFEDGLLTL